MGFDGPSELGGHRPVRVVRFLVIRQPDDGKGVAAVPPVAIGELDQAHPLARHIGDFLTDLANANASGHNLRACCGDLAQFAAHHDGEIRDLGAATVRAYLAELVGLAPSTRKRKRAAVASFCRWAVRHDLLHANPMDKVDTVKVPRRLPAALSCDNGTYHRVPWPQGVTAEPRVAITPAHRRGQGR
jgi:Phage integrase, N-terminal SAM-like domain